MHGHVTKILAGRERKREREGNGRSTIRPAEGANPRPKRSLPARSRRREGASSPTRDPVRRSPPSRPLLLPPAKFLSRAAKSFSRAPNRFLTRLFEGLSPKSNPEQTPPNPSSVAAPSTSPIEMSRSSKRTSAPAPMEIPTAGAQSVFPKGLISFLRWASLPGRPSLLFHGRSSPWRPSLPYWIPGQQRPGMAAQGPWWSPANLGAPANQEPDLQAWCMLPP